MLLLISLQIYGRSHSSIVVSRKGEYVFDLQLDLKDFSEDIPQEDYVISWSQCRINGSEVQWFAIEKNGSIRDGKVPVRITLPEEESERIIAGDNLQVLRVGLQIEKNGSLLPLTTTQGTVTFIVDIDDIIVDVNSQLDFGTLYCNEEISEKVLLRERILRIRYPVDTLSGGYIPMVSIAITGGTAPPSFIEVEGGSRGSLYREIELSNESEGSSDTFKLKGDYTIYFEDTNNGAIDLELRPIEGEFPKETGIYRGNEMNKIENFRSINPYLLQCLCSLVE